MEGIIDGKFYSPTCGNITKDEMLEEIVKYMESDPEKFYEVIVGCDSSSSQEPNFPIALAVLKTGEGGRFFLRKIKYPPSFNKRFVVWKNRILQETLLACELAQSLRDEFKNKIHKNLRYQFRYIHADIGENGETKEMIKELTGLIRGNGFEPKIKPEAYIATTLADKYS